MIQMFKKLLQRLWMLSSVCGILFFIGCATHAPSPTRQSVNSPQISKADGGGESDVAIRQGDVINLRITGIIPEIALSDLVVNEFGMISLPHIQDVKAEGLTAGVLAKKIERAYIDGGYYTKLSVSITPGPREFYVHGEVRVSGKALWTPGLTLVKAISLMGGFNEFADRADIQVRRKDAIIKVNYKEAEKDPNKDIEIYPRDDIKVGRTLF